MNQIATANLHFTLATAGHVDHGKTSLLRALTGIDPDRLKEEKEREMTTDIGFAHLSLSLAQIEKDFSSLKSLIPKLDSQKNLRFEASAKLDPESKITVSFVDVPGHGKFIKNMLAGVGGIDAALLVVASDEGVMPQTIQHVKILSLLGIKNCVLALTKCDLVGTDEPELALDEVKELLAQYDINLVDYALVSNTTKSGMDELKSKIIALLLSQSHIDKRFDSNGNLLPAYLPVDRVFSKPGYGVVVTGTLVSGQIKIGDNLILQPGDIEGRVRGLESCGKSIKENNSAFPGQRLAVNLVLKGNESVERGHVAISQNRAAIKDLIVQVSDLGGLKRGAEKAKKTLKAQQVLFYNGTAESVGTFRWLEKLDSNTVIAQIHLKDPVLTMPGQRFVVRYGDNGIAGGQIIITHRPRWLTRERIKTIATQCINKKYSQAMIDYLSFVPAGYITRHELFSLLPPALFAQELQSLITENKVLESGDLITAESTIANLKKKALSLLESAKSGLSQEEMRVKLAPLFERSLFHHLLENLEKSGAIAKGEGDKYVLPQNKTEEKVVDPNFAKISEYLEKEFCIEIETLSKELRIPGKQLALTLRKMEQEKLVSIVNQNFVSSGASIAKAHKVLFEIWQSKKNISPSEFREKLGVSRKYTMELLAYFDERQITRRTNDGRALLKAPKG
ncbi:MAG: selenocysteine-specific translation elongation factor [Candidatus Melainabacteria bacterium]|nr:selenocysteine-specific translation elongation factor [Candidatus Melainabacteria bacterium]